MRESELKKIYLTTEHGVFTPLYSFDSFSTVKQGDTEEVEFVNLKVIKTAEEVYNEWLRDNVQRLNI